MVQLIDVNLAEISRICRSHGVRTLEVFGSILRQDFDHRESDVDMLVDFEPALASSFANFMSLKQALEDLLGRRVDLLELRSIRNRRLRSHIEQSRSPVYSAEALPGTISGSRVSD